MPLIKLLHRKKHKIRLIRGGSFVNNLLNTLSLPELHLLDSDKKYNYCGPYTKLHKRLVLDANGNILHVVTEPINELDRGCMYHDVAYDKHKDVPHRNEADKQLYQVANNIYHNSHNKLDKFNAGIVKQVMNTKIKYNM